MARSLSPALLERALKLAEAAAAEAGQLLLQRFRLGARPETSEMEEKPDGTVVTDVDKAAEAAIRARLAADPDFGGLDVLGEEGGEEAKGGGSELRWVVDPLDGTKSFTCGTPTFGAIVALEDRGRSDAFGGLPVVGATHCPAMGHAFAAAEGLGAAMNGRAIRVARPQALRAAIVSSADPMQFRVSHMEAAYQRLREACDHLRGYTECWGHGMVAAGAVAAHLEPWQHQWDIAATRILIAEAGGLCLMRASSGPGDYDAIFGEPGLVREIAALIEF